MVVLAEIVIAVLPPHRTGKYDVNFLGQVGANAIGSIWRHPVQPDADIVCMDKPAWTNKFNMHCGLAVFYEKRIAGSRRRGPVERQLQKMLANRKRIGRCHDADQRGGRGCRVSGRCWLPVHMS